jgi:CRISPR/Cas system CMR subunit Cmr4 (Cas7 group RAMP superfamily)
MDADGKGDKNCPVTFDEAKALFGPVKNVRMLSLRLLMVTTPLALRRCLPAILRRIENLFFFLFSMHRRTVGFSSAYVD